MKNNIFFALVVYPILPILLFLLGWWVSLPFIEDKYLYIPTLFGFLLGILLNIFIIRKQENNFYKANIFILLGIMLFYHIGIFGFFMGVPIFNIIPGLLSAIYLSKRGFIQEKILYIFNTIFLTLICVFSGYLALSDPTTASNLEGMFNLPFELTSTHLWLIIIIGWIFLIGLQFYISRMILYKYGNRKRVS